MPEDMKGLLEVYQRADDTKRSKQKLIRLTEKGTTALKILVLLHQQYYQSQATGVDVRATQSGIIDYALRQQLEMMLKRIREEQERGRGTP